LIAIQKPVIGSIARNDQEQEKFNDFLKQTILHLVQYVGAPSHTNKVIKSLIKKLSSQNNIEEVLNALFGISNDKLIEKLRLISFIIKNQPVISGKFAEQILTSD